MTNRLLWEKYRPKTMEDVILLPRIRKYFINGIDQNYIFYGSYGTGKTTLARILIGKYSKKSAFLEINASLHTSIETLRNEIDSFCRTKSMLDVEDDIKYVFLDEFERVSVNFQDALKAFIEGYHKNVRFIMTTNNLSKISDGIKNSRVTKINFNCLNDEESKFLRNEMYKRIHNTILPKEGKEIEKNQLINIINKSFPDFRSVMVGLQNYINGYEDNEADVNSTIKIKSELYKILLKDDLTYEDIYHFLMANYGGDNMDILLSTLSTGFIKYGIENNIDSDKLFKCNYIVTTYEPMIVSAKDPLFIGMTVIGKFRDVLIHDKEIYC